MSKRLFVATITKVSENGEPTLDQWGSGAWCNPAQLPLAIEEDYFSTFDQARDAAATLLVEAADELDLE